MLWTVFQLNSILWSTPSGLEKTMQILADGLERSRNLPITVQIFDQLSLPPPTRLFDLLARHSERWQRAHIMSSIEDIDLSVLKGKLPLLQYLVISVSGTKSPEPSATQILDLCQDVPCLKIVYIPTVLLENITIPFQQLNVLACEVSGPASVARAVSVMPKLRRGASYHLQFFSRDEANPLIPLHIPPTTSTISLLDWRIVGDIYSRHYSHALGEFLANLTLPNLAELRVMCGEYPRQEILNLCARSGFERCLKVLRIPEVFITEEDLIQLLSRLESLEHLEIGDKYGEGTESVLVTDTFLRAIALPAASSHMPHLVPRLRHFACFSKMGFTDNIFIDFVISRLVGCSPENPLSITLCPPTYIDMALHCAAPVHAAMERLVARSKRRLSTRSAPRLPTTLANLFGGAIARPFGRPARRAKVVSEEALYMELLAAEHSDEEPDAGALEGSGREVVAVVNDDNDIGDEKTTTSGAVELPTAAVAPSADAADRGGQQLRRRRKLKQKKHTLKKASIHRGAARRAYCKHRRGLRGSDVGLWAAAQRKYPGVEGGTRGKAPTLLVGERLAGVYIGDSPDTDSPFALRLFKVEHGHMTAIQAAVVARNTRRTSSGQGVMESAGGQVSEDVPRVHICRREV
ncbi:hypothetical protein GGX14DRAFT_600121 [Mycena pura]|uniref:F-box domain-containing protein n=1 Tax=Mycena pura TaxID=153505 RepID=A0AAD6XXH6_9AGAR|nr:hypothetical protein GGX14DRAFT_600121 [Mycena pura]